MTELISAAAAAMRNVALIPVCKLKCCGSMPTAANPVSTPPAPPLTAAASKPFSQSSIRFIRVYHCALEFPCCVAHFRDPNRPLLLSCEWPTAVEYSPNFWFFPRNTSHDKSFHEALLDCRLSVFCDRFRLHSVPYGCAGKGYEQRIGRGQRGSPAQRRGGHRFSPTGPECNGENLVGRYGGDQSAEQVRDQATGAGHGQVRLPGDHRLRPADRVPPRLRRHRYRCG